MGPAGVDSRAFDWGAALLVAAVVAAVLARRRHPVPAGVLGLCAMIAWFAFGYHGKVVLAVSVIVCVTLTIVLGRWSGVFAGLLTMAAGLGSIWTLFEGSEAIEYSVNAILLTTTSVAVGEAIRYYLAWRASMFEQVAYLERERAAEAARLVHEERLRIAYEVHDVIAHSIASISVQAGVAAYVLERRPEKAKEALDAIKQTASGTLRELRLVLGALRADDGDPDDRDPVASLDRLPELTRMARTAGLRTDVTVVGAPTVLPTAIELAAYRIIQEALTNVIRHAGASAVAIELAYRTDELHVTVSDNGSGTTDFEGSGSGIAGMRERARTLGGRLDAGRFDGGFRVVCRLPVGVSRPETSPDKARA